MTTEQKLQKMVNDLRGYTSKTRATYADDEDDDAFCVYYDPKTKNKCLIGKQIPDSILMQLEEYWGGTNIDELFTKSPEVEELEIFKNICIDTLDDLQRIHDINTNYDEKGLTEKGVDNLNRLIVEINEEYKVNVK